MKKEYVAPKFELVYLVGNLGNNDLGNASGIIGDDSLIPEDGWD